jgi:hypothetical protein
MMSSLLANRCVRWSTIVENAAEAPLNHLCASDLASGASKSDDTGSVPLFPFQTLIRPAFTTSSTGQGVPPSSNHTSRSAVQCFSKFQSGLVTHNLAHLIGTRTALARLARPG